MGAVQMQMHNLCQAVHESGRKFVEYVRVLISLRLFLLTAQPKEYILDGLKKLEQRSQKCVELRGEYIYYQLLMGFHPVAVAQYNTQGTPTNHKEHITQINTLRTCKTPSRIRE
jgi:hypothetical protein